MEPSAFQELEAVVRQILALRAGGASQATIDATIEAARELWGEVPSPPVGTKMVWAPDLAAIADELGFTASAAVAPLDDDMQKMIGEAGRLQKLASEIDKAIVESGGIGNVRVACSPQRVVLTGIAADEEARDQALIVAAKLAPGMEIEDAIDVAWSTAVDLISGSPLGSLFQSSRRSAITSPMPTTRPRNHTR